MTNDRGSAGGCVGHLFKAYRNNNRRSCPSSAQNCWQAFLELRFAPVIGEEWATWKTATTGTYCSLAYSAFARVGEGRSPQAWRPRKEFLYFNPSTR
jgi:hypothetical protein